MEVAAFLAVTHAQCPCKLVMFTSCVIRTRHHRRAPWETSFNSSLTARSSRAVLSSLFAGTMSTDLKHLGFVKSYATTGVEAVANSKTCVHEHRAVTCVLCPLSSFALTPPPPPPDTKVRQGRATVHRHQGEQRRPEVRP